MRGLFAVLAITAALVLVGGVGASGPNEQQRVQSATLMPGEYTATETDTLDGTVLRTKATESMGGFAPSTQCNDAQDNDGDGLIDYPRDPGCASATDDDEYNPPPPPPPAPPPPPPPPPPPAPPPPPPDHPLASGVYGESQYNECGGQPTYPCLTTPDVIRCKRVVFRQEYIDRFYVWNPVVGHYDGQWKVCYHPYGNGITSVEYRTGDATFSDPWDWMGNDNGYPSHARDTHRVTVYYRGSAHICIVGFACGPQKHPWLTFVFTDAGLYGSVSRTWGVS